MNVFEKVILHWQADENFDLIRFLASLQPITPPDSQIHMGRFDLDSLRNCILLNIYSQGLVLKSNTTRDLIGFLKEDFTDTTKQIYLQVLLHLVKMDVGVMQSYIPESKRIPPAEYFNQKIATYVRIAKKDYDEAIIPVSEEVKTQIKDALLRKSILKALESALNVVSSNLYGLNTKQEICNLEIYSVNIFAPLAGLRGVCLTNGIMFCNGNLALPLESISYQADLITLTAHECCHYLARLSSNNFNFLSPFNFNCPSREIQRTDPTNANMPLELGRFVELALFDGIQPSWRNSSELAAQTFMERVQHCEGTPVIKKSEHQKLELIPRLFASPPFGIDIEEHQLYD